MPHDEDEACTIAELVRERMDEVRANEVVADGGRLHVPLIAMDGETLPQLRARIAAAQTPNGGYKMPPSTISGLMSIADAELFANDAIAQREAIGREWRNPSAAEIADAEQAARDAYDQRSREAKDAWRTPPTATPAAAPVGAINPNMTTDELRAAAEDAWRKRGVEIRNAWRR